MIPADKLFYTEMYKEYEISTDPARLNMQVVHEFLSQEAYWSPGVPLEIVACAIENSLPFGAYLGGEQVGFGRVVSDYATFAWLADVFVRQTWRGIGIGKALVGAMRRHPALQGMRLWMLATRDAQGLYEKYGFQPIGHPDRLMEIRVKP